MNMQNHNFSDDPVVIENMHEKEISDWAEEEVVETYEDTASWVTEDFRVETFKETNARVFLEKLARR